MIEYVSPTGVYIQPNTGNTTISSLLTIAGGSSTDMNLPTAWTTGRWYAVEWYVASNGLTVWVDGIQIGTLSGSINFGAPYPQLGIINSCPVNGTYSLYIDGAAASSSRVYPASKIEIGNSATYASATKVYQAPTAISNTSVSVVANLAGLGSGPYYLFVTNNRNEISSAYNLSGGGDTTPPVISGGSPSGEQAYGTTSVNMTVTTDEAATCKFGTTDAAYASLPNTFSTTGGTSHSQAVSVSNGGSYTRYVRCIDSAGNSNTASSVISWTVAASAPSQTVFFSEGFEDTNFAARGWYDDTTGTLSTDAYAGTYSLQCTYAAGGTGCVVPRRHKFTGSDSVYVSYRVKYSSNFVGSGVSYHPHEFYFLTNLNGDYDGLAFDYLTLYLESHWGSSSSGTMQVGFQDGQNIDQSKIGQNLIGVTENRAVAGCNGSPSGYVGECYNRGDGVYVNGVLLSTPQTFTTANKNNWNHVEAYYRLNSISNGIGQADGIIRVWFNGSLVFERTNAVLRTGQRPTMKLNQLVFAPWIGDGSPVTQTFWIDDLVVADAPSGTTYTVTPSAGANGSISPNTAQTVNSGSTTAFTVTPNAGYTASASGCGGSLSGTTYTTGAISANCSVAASFCKKLSVPASLVATGLTPNPPSNATLSFDWADVNSHTDSSALSGDLANYRLHWGTTSGGPYNTASSSPSAISVGPTQANITYYARVGAESSLNAVCNSDLSSEISFYADTVPPVLSGLGPSGSLAKDTTSATLSATTSESATCRYGDKGAAWSSRTLFSTTGSTSHSSSIPVWAGLVKRVCTLCRDALGNESADGCTSFSVNAKPKRWQVN